MKNQWRGSARELGVIVLGILLALGVDASWDALQDRRAGRDLVASLVTEFTRNRTMLQASLEAHQEIDGQVVALIEKLEGLPDGVVVLPDTAFIGVYRWRIANPEFGTTQSILASGRLQLLDSPDLQAALAAWPAKLDDVRERELTTERFADGPLVSGLADAGDHNRAIRIFPDSLRSLVRSGSEATVEFRNSAEARNLLAKKSRNHYAAASGLAALLMDLEAVLILLDSY